MHKVDKRINLDLSKANIVFKFILVRLSITRVRISFSCSWSWWNVTQFFCIVFLYLKKNNVFLWLLSTRLFCCNINYTWSHINYDSSSGLIKFDEIPTRIYVPIHTYSNNNWYIISFIYICCKLKQLHCFIISCLWWFNKIDDLINITLQIYVNNIASIRITS